MPKPREIRSQQRDLNSISVVFLTDIGGRPPIPHHRLGLLDGVGIPDDTPVMMNLQGVAAGSNDLPHGPQDKRDPLWGEGVREGLLGLRSARPSLTADRPDTESTGVFVGQGAPADSALPDGAPVPESGFIGVYRDLGDDRRLGIPVDSMEFVA